MDIMDMIRLLFEAVISGTQCLVRVGQRNARRFLVFLMWVAIACVGSTLIWGAIGIGASSRGLTAFAGLWGLLAFGVLSLVGAPIGVLVSIALPMGTTTTPATAAPNPPWYTWFNPFRFERALANYKRGAEKRIRDGVERYFKTARLVLACTGFFFGFSALLPISGNRDSMMVIAVLAISIGFSLAHDTVWMKWLRGLAVAGIALTIPGMIFPRVNWIGLLFPTPSAQALTDAQIKTGTLSWWNWFNQSYNQPAMYVLYILAGIAVTLLCIWWYKRTPSAMATAHTTASGGGDAHAPAHAGGHDEHGGHGGFSLGGFLKKNTATVWAVVGIVLIITLVVYIGGTMQANAVGTQTAIDTAAERRANVLVASVMAMTAQPTWHGLRNAVEHEVELSTTNWCRTLTKPAGKKSRWSLWAMPGLIVQANESTILRSDQITVETGDIRNFRFRLSGTNGITSTNMLVAFGD